MTMVAVQGFLDNFGMKRFNYFYYFTFTFNYFTTTEWKRQKEMNV